jgi:long-chain acyl-CoA synthetase
MSATAIADIRCLADIVRVHSARRGDAVAVECAGRSHTFSEFYDRAQAVAGALAAAGVGNQDRVAVIEHNGIEVLEVVFGAALLNAVVVNVNWRLAPPEILQILADAETNLVLVGADFIGAVEAIEADLGDKAQVVAFGDHDRWEGYETWLARHQPGDPGTVAAPDDVAFQLYTSGTTGLPKGVMLTTSNVLALAEGRTGDWSRTARSI